MNNSYYSTSHFIDTDEEIGLTGQSGLVNHNQSDCLGSKYNRAPFTIPLIFGLSIAHIIPTLSLVLTLYVCKENGYESNTLDQLIEYLSSPLTKTFFFGIWGLIFIITLVILHWKEDRIRNRLFSGVFFTIITLEMTILMVVTIVILASSSSNIDNNASYYITIVLLNLLTVLCISSLISSFMTCARRDGFMFRVKIILCILQMLTYSFLSNFGILDSYLIQNINPTMRIVWDIVADVCFGIIAIGLLSYLHYTIRGKHRHFNQNRLVILINAYKYDEKISSFAYVVSFYNDLTWCLKHIFMFCIRMNPSRTTLIE